MATTKLVKWLARMLHPVQKLTWKVPKSSKYHGNHQNMVVTWRWGKYLLVLYVTVLQMSCAYEVENWRLYAKIANCGFVLSLWMHASHARNHISSQPQGSRKSLWSTSVCCVYNLCLTPHLLKHTHKSNKCVCSNWVLKAILQPTRVQVNRNFYS